MEVYFFLKMLARRRIKSQKLRFLGKFPIAGEILKNDFQERHIANGHPAKQARWLEHKSKEPFQV